MLCVFEGLRKRHLPQATPPAAVLNWHLLPCQPIPWCCWPPGSSFIQQILVGAVMREHASPSPVRATLGSWVDLSSVSITGSKEGQERGREGGKEEGREGREGGNAEGGREKGT